MKFKNSAELENCRKSFYRFVAVQIQRQGARTKRVVVYTRNYFGTEIMPS